MVESQNGSSGPSTLRSRYRGGWRRRAFFAAKTSVFVLPAFRRFKLAQMARGGEGLHLPDGNLIKPFQPFALWQIHVDELGIHALNVGQHEQLLDGGVFAHVAVQFRIGVAPLPGGLAKQGHVEQIGFVGVRDGGLRRRNLRRDEMGLHRVGMNPVIELGKGAIEIPSQGEAAVFVVLEPLELLDEVVLNSGLIHMPNSKAMSLWP